MRWYLIAREALLLLIGVGAIAIGLLHPSVFATSRMIDLMIGGVFLFYAFRADRDRRTASSRRGRRA
jgi:hypothetical protein